MAKSSNFVHIDCVQEFRSQVGWKEWFVISLCPEIRILFTNLKTTWKKLDTGKNGSREKKKEFRIEIRFGLGLAIWVGWPIPYRNLYFASIVLLSLTTFHFLLLLYFHFCHSLERWRLYEMKCSRQALIVDSNLAFVEHVGCRFT